MDDPVTPAELVDTYDGYVLRDQGALPVNTLIICRYPLRRQTKIDLLFGLLLPARLHELLQRQAVGRQRTLQQIHRFALREPSDWKVADHASSHWFGPRSCTASVVRQSRKGVSLSKA